MNLFQEVAVNIITSGFITGIFVFIINKAIESRFAMKLEAYKDELKAESDKELMQLTKDLELRASERNIKLTGIFERQAETILAMYKKLNAMQKALQHFISMRLSKDPTERSESNDAVTFTWNELFEFYFENKVLLKPATAEKMEKLRLLYSGVFFGHMILGAKKEPLSEEDLEERIQRRNQINKEEDEIIEVRQALENDFQKILGVSIDEIAGK